MKKWAIAAIAVLLACSPAFASECGGETPCQCGDSIVQSIVINESMECDGTGLVIAGSNIFLDCGSNSITFSAGNGIEVAGVENVTIRNCVVYDSVGSMENSSDIFLKSSINIILENVSIAYGYSGFGLLLENTSHLSAYNINVTASGSKKHGIFINSSSHNTFEKTAVHAAEQDSYSISFSAFSGMNSSENAFSNTTLSGTPRIYSRSNFSDVSCAEKNLFTDPSGFDRNSITFEDENGPSQCNNILLAWSIRAGVYDISGKPLAGASVNLSNEQNFTEEMGTTDSDGMTEWRTANDTLFSHDPAFEINYSMHSFDAYAYGFFPGLFHSKIDGTKTLEFVLNDSLAPEINLISAETDAIHLDGSVKINASITDNVEVSSAWFVVETPEGELNITAERGEEDEFYIICNSTNECKTNNTGQYNLTSVWANDTTGNSASAEGLSVNFIVSEQDWIEISESYANSTSARINDSLVFNASVTGSAGIAEVRFFVETPNGSYNITAESSGIHYYVICNSTNECRTNMTGQYNLTSVWANDTKGNCKSEAYDTLSFTISYPPALEMTQAGSGNITTSSAGIFVETNENSFCRYSSQDKAYEYMESNFSATGGKSHSSGIEGLSPNTAYTYYAKCVDQYGNETNASAVITFTTAIPASGSPAPSGGGSGGGYSPAASSPGKYGFSKMESGTAYKISINDKSRGLKAIEIQIKTTSYGVSIYATKLVSQPASVPQITGAKPFEWFNISKENLEDSAIEYVKIGFNVTKKWLSENGMVPEDIALYRYSNGWERLTTSVRSQSSNEYEFESYSPGFSVFSIAGKKEQKTVVLQYCGNGVLDPYEECDGSKIGNYTCQFFGYDTGSLGCNEDCTISTENCSSFAMVRKTGSPASGKVILRLPSGDFDLLLAIIVVISIIVAVAMAVYFLFFRK